MDLKWVKTFVTVYEVGSFRAAADKLFMSQPSVTVHIQALEEALHVQLFTRSHTKVALTDVAHYYYPRAKALLEEVTKQSQQVQAFAASRTTRMTVALSAALASTTIIKHIHDFLQHHPAYEIEVMTEPANTVDALLREGKVDVVFSLQRTKAPALHSEQLLREAPQLVFSAQYVLQRQPIDQQLAALFETYPLYAGYMDEHDAILHWLQKEYRLRTFSHVKDSVLAIQLMKENIGVSIVPPFIVRNELAERKLQALQLGAIADMHTVSLYMSHKREEARLQPFLQYMRAQVST